MLTKKIVVTQAQEQMETKVVVSMCSLPVVAIHVGNELHKRNCKTNFYYKYAMKKSNRTKITTPKWNTYQDWGRPRRHGSRPQNQLLKRCLMLYDYSCTRRFRQDIIELRSYFLL